MRMVTLEALELFVERVEKLNTFDFVRFPKLAHFNWHWNQGNDKVEITGPRNQDIDAFLLTYRFFFDKNEHCSFRWLAENVYIDPSLSEGWKSGFIELREYMNPSMYSYPPIKVTNEYYPFAMTNREIKDIFLFGDLSHANLDKRKRFKQLMSHRPTQGLLFSQFVEILIITFHIIIKVFDLCKLELDKNVSRE